MNIRAEFERWLDNYTNLGKDTIKQYIYALTKIPEALLSGESQLGIINNIYEISDIKQLTQLKKEFSINGPFYEHNIRYGNQVTTASLGKYMEFLSSQKHFDKANASFNNKK